MSAAPFPILPSRTLQDLGERVALARRARGLTQRDLAHLAGVGASSIVALEKGHPGVAVGTLARALDALGLLAEMDELALYTPKMNVASQNLQAVTASAKYLQDMGRFGSLQFSGNYTNMLKREVQAQPGEDALLEPLQRDLRGLDSALDARSDDGQRVLRLRSRDRVD